jgi:hypothetical protein
MSLRGGLFVSKGQPGVLDRIRVEGTTRDQFVRIPDFGMPGRSAVFRPDRVRIEEADGSLLMQRETPRASFGGHVETTSWDPLHLTYFSGCTTWDSLTTPFFMAGPGFQTEELEPWQERGEIWRRLFVWFPGTIAAHASQQTFYFGNDGLQRRVDYCAEGAGGVEVANYCMEHKTFSGITLPTRRRVMRRDVKNNAAPTPILVDVSIADAAFW